MNYPRLINHDNFAPDLVQLIRTAIMMQFDGVVIPNWLPEAEVPAIKVAIAAGITAILMTAGGAAKASERGAAKRRGHLFRPTPRRRRPISRSRAVCSTTLTWRIS